MLIFLFSALIVLCDQFFKRWIIITHHVGEETVLIPGVLSLFRLHNPGAAFGFLTNQPWWLLAAVQLLAAILLIMIIMRYTDGFWGSLGLAAVLGGTVGNLIDRVFTFNADYPHHVTDMFRFMFVDFAIFNVADMFITLGFITFLIHFIVVTFKSDKKKRSVSNADAIDDDPEDEKETFTPVTKAATTPVPVTFDDFSAAENLTDPFLDSNNDETTASQKDSGFPPDDHQNESETVIEIAPLLDQIYGGEYLPKEVISQHIHPDASGKTEDRIKEDITKQDTSEAPAENFFEEQTISVVSIETVAKEPSDEGVSVPNVESKEDVTVEVITDTSSESLLDVLSTLESELLGEDDIDNYDVNKLLGEYGFESDES